MRTVPVAARLLVLALVGSVTTPAAAQTEVGAFVGHVMDEGASGSQRFGAEARWPIRGTPLQLQPRISDQPGTGGEGATVELDVNVVYQVGAAPGWPIAPYVGLGGGYNHVGGDVSASKIVGNFVAGFRLKLGDNSRFTPFVNSQYEFAKNFTNLYLLEAGVLYSLQGR